MTTVETTAMASAGGGAKMRRHRPTAAAQPQDRDDVECGKSDRRPSVECEDALDEKDVLGRRAAALLSDLGPVSRRLVRFVTPANPSLPDRCTSEGLTVAALRILPSLSLLLFLPFVIWDGYPEWSAFDLYPLIRHADLVWSSLFHMSSWPIAIGTVLVAALLPRGGVGSKYLPQKGRTVMDKAKARLSAVMANVTKSSWKTSLVLSIFFSSTVIVNMTLQMAYPHLIWNPFIWATYRVYLPEDISPALKGACLDSPRPSRMQPLCLSEREWNELSSGQLSSYNPDDVLAVRKGLDYLQNQSGGLVINALARNVADSIPALKENMEGLSHFFKDSESKLSLVIFENDSNDGTREAFQSWADEEANRTEPRYTVDLMGCGPNNPNCELGVMDRYDNTNLFVNPTASGVGKLGEFRQILLENILKQERYEEYSHMVVLDVDLGTSISPLGLLHTLGLENDLGQEHVVASASSQVWPGTMGTILPPYDLSAFRPKESKSNAKVREMHRSFCEMMPAGDRWRNMCDATSPMQLFMIRSSNDVTSHHGRPYEVVSAFNGLTMYPLSLIRDRGDKAKYDAGADNQRCEHVGFNLSLDRAMYVNPKWSMKLKPSKPGGPTGVRTIQMLLYAVIGRPNVMLCLVVGDTAFFFVFVYACYVVGASIRDLFLLLGSPRERKRVDDGHHYGADKRELLE